MALTYVFLAAAAFGTSLISGMLGMGGGSLFLAVLSSFLPHAEAISMHSAVQLAGLGTRSLVFLRHIDWPTFRRFTLGMIPGTAAGAALLAGLGPASQMEPWLKGLIGAYVLVVLALPKPRATGAGTRAWEWTAVGVVAGVGGLFVGAVGPMIGPLFARHGLLKERLIATKAACQLLGHAVKLPVLLTVRDLDVVRFGGLVVLLVAMVIPATMLGERLLKYVSAKWFERIYVGALVVTGGKLIVVDCVAGLVS